MGKKLADGILFIENTRAIHSYICNIYFIKNLLEVVDYMMKEVHALR